MILDTNAISALAGKQSELIEKLEDVSALTTTIVSVGEYAYGVRRSNRREELEAWFRHHLLTRVEVLTPDLTTTEHYADIRQELRSAGTPIPANDIWIAALAREHQMPILSTDEHFDRVAGVNRVAW